MFPPPDSYPLAPLPLKSRPRVSIRFFRGISFSIIPPQWPMGVPSIPLRPCFYGQFFPPADRFLLLSSLVFFFPPNTSGLFTHVATEDLLHPVFPTHTAALSVIPPRCPRHLFFGFSTPYARPLPFTQMSQ